MSFVMDLLQSASRGILSIYEHPITLILFIFFLLWASIHDLKTKKIKNYQNLAFVLVGFLLTTLTTAKVYDFGFELGTQHFWGVVVGFLLLFIPGMILNYAFGGDIKFAAAMGFWVGPSAILLVMLLATIIQLLILLSGSLITKSFSLESSFPFAPAFSIAYVVALAVLLIL